MRHNYSLYNTRIVGKDLSCVEVAVVGQGVWREGAERNVTENTLQ